MAKANSQIVPPKHGFKLELGNDELDAYVRQVNGRADKYTFSPVRIVVIGDDLEKALDDARIASSKRVGVTAVVRSAGPDKSRSTVQWSARGDGTEAHYRRYAEGWRLMSANRVQVFGGQRQQCRISIDRRDYEAIRDRAVAQFDIAVPAP